ncbi:MAG TPA: hypothetical protein VGS10_18710 [Terracidiphilus sp.]|nr:hypothetical protein [Terracidiphilus sp.]
MAKDIFAGFTTVAKSADLKIAQNSGSSELQASDTLQVARSHGEQGAAPMQVFEHAASARSDLWPEFSAMLLNVCAHAGPGFGNPRAPGFLRNIGTGKRVAKNSDIRVSMCRHFRETKRAAGQQFQGGEKSIIVNCIAAIQKGTVNVE